MLLPMLSLLILISCGSSDDDSTTTVELPENEIAEEFSTRLSSNLLIAGTPCEGSETVVFENQTYRCERDEWLIVIDNVNTCDASGVCTEARVEPIVAELVFTDIIRIPEYTTFEIRPDSPVTPAQQNIIDDVWVRMEFNGEGEVVFR